jgi:hypothetical protein
MGIVRVRRRVRLLEWVPEEGAGPATGGLPPGSVVRPLARFVAARRVRVNGSARFAGSGQLGGGGVTPPEPPPSSKRRRHRWFPGLSRRRPR